MSVAKRIPPPEVDLEFARNTKTSAVHILCYGPAREWVPSTRPSGSPAAIVLGFYTAPCRMLCGAKLLVGVDESCPAVWASGDHFPDDDLCFRCVMALGEQQWRAFDSGIRGAADA